MMKLNHRYGRNLRHSLSFYLSATILTALGVVFLISMYSGFFAIDTGFAEIMEAENVEDARLHENYRRPAPERPPSTWSWRKSVMWISRKSFHSQGFAEAKKIRWLCLRAMV